MTDTKETLVAILSAPELDDATCEDLILHFTIQNPIEFAKYLHGLDGVSDATKSQLLAVKVAQKPGESQDALSEALEERMQKFWTQLLASSKVAAS
jgi:hypothetical protein